MRMIRSAGRQKGTNRRQNGGITMKKILIIMLAIACFFTLPDIAAADAGVWIRGQEKASAETGTREGEKTSDRGWPVKDFSNCAGTGLRDLPEESMRHQSVFGPGAGYPGAGAYKPYKVLSAKALVREGNYVLVDMSYQTVGRRCVYFKASALTNNDAEETETTGWPVRTTKYVNPRFGPGYSYDSVTKTVRDPEYDSNIVTALELNPGTRAEVFFESNGWVFAEFECTMGRIRAWIPADAAE